MSTTRTLIYLPPYFVEIPQGKTWRKWTICPLDSLPFSVKRGDELHILPRNAETEKIYQEAEKVLAK